MSSHEQQFNEWSQKSWYLGGHSGCALPLQVPQQVRWARLFVFGVTLLYPYHLCNHALKIHCGKGKVDWKQEVQKQPYSCRRRVELSGCAYIWPQSQKCIQNFLFITLNSNEYIFLKNKLSQFSCFKMIQLSFVLTSQSSEQNIVWTIQEVLKPWGSSFGYKH